MAYGSSYLVDPKFSKDRYSADKAFDEKDETAWVAGGKNDGIDEFLVFQIIVVIEDSFPKSTYLEIKNGLYKSSSLYFANNRIKRAELEIYECDAGIRGMYWTVFQKPILNTIINIDFEDKMEVKKIKIDINNKLKSKQEFPIFLFVGKLTVKEIYKGKLYNDTCISEINSYAGQDILD